MKPNARAVLDALALSLDIEEVLRRFPGLDRETLRRIISAAAAKMPAAAKSGYRLVAFIDGAARGNPGDAGAGVVIKDSEGAVVEKIALYLGKTTNNTAEYQALLQALRRAGELGASSLQVYSDSELLVQQINGRYRVRAPHLQELCQKAIRLMRGFDIVNVSHIPRDRNADADEQANLAIERSRKG